MDRITSIASSELLVNEDGSIFHLHIKPEELTDAIVLVGDPDRVAFFEEFMSKLVYKRRHREFCVACGIMNEKPVTVISTGIGPDNIDIVLNELDALANIDFTTRKEREQKRHLTIVRIGTCGTLCADIPTGDYIVSGCHIGLDGVLHYYRDSEKIRDHALEEAFISQINWPQEMATPYAVYPNEHLVKKLCTCNKSHVGVTITAIGFYGPQGRELRFPLRISNLPEQLEQFHYEDKQITNFEMESAAVAGLARLMGHYAATICLVIANRYTGESLTDYYNPMKGLIGHVIDTLTK